MRGIRRIPSNKTRCKIRRKNGRKFYRIDDHGSFIYGISIAFDAVRAVDVVDHPVYADRHSDHGDSIRRICDN